MVYYNNIIINKKHREGGGGDGRFLDTPYINKLFSIKILLKKR